MKLTTTLFSVAISALCFSTTSAAPHGLRMQAQENTRQEQHTLWPRNVAVARVAGKALFKQAAKKAAKELVTGLGENALENGVKDGLNGGKKFAKVVNSAAMKNNIITPMATLADLARNCGVEACPNTHEENTG
jgi:hypothetical protein